MPLARYFFFVGGVLLALLFIVDAVVPSLPVSDRTDRGTTNKSIIRIQSDRKWPERVVFDTSLPTIIPVLTAKAEIKQPVVSVPATTAEASAKARVRETFAQLQSSDPKKIEPKLQRKRKIAKNRVAPPIVLVAQQPRFGFFANNTW
jgi:hypothetical protein